MAVLLNKTNRICAKRPIDFVNDTPLQSTLRELHRLARTPRALGLIGLVGIVLGVSGPFDTYAEFPLGGRLAYWLIIVFATFFIGYGAARFIDKSLARLPFALRFAVSALIVGGLAELTVFTVEMIAMGHSIKGPAAALELYIYCVLISAAVVAGIVAMTSRTPAPPTGLAPTAPPEAQPPRLMDRLPPAIRGPLIRLSVQDHYVEVETTRGKTLVLMRLSDAIKETEGVAGLQIHRSHWVAEAAIAETARADGRLWICLTTGERLPVSRSFAGDVIAAAARAQNRA